MIRMHCKYLVRINLRPDCRILNPGDQNSRILVLMPGVIYHQNPPGVSDSLEMKVH